MKSLEFVVLHRNEFEVINSVRTFDPYSFSLSVMTRVGNFTYHGLTYLDEKEDNIFKHVAHMKDDEQGRLPDGLTPVFEHVCVTTNNLNVFNFFTESTFGITARSEADRYSNRQMNANNLAIKEIEGELY